VANSTWAWLASLFSGVVASLIASIAYDQDPIVVFAIFLLIPLLYFVSVIAFGYYRIGIRGVYPNWSSLGFNTSKAISKCKKSFCFMTVTGRTSLHQADVEAALKERCAVGRCEVRVLLLHPLSQHLQKFCEFEGSSLEQTREKILATTRSLLVLKRENQLSIEVRWYDSFPIWRLAIIDGSIVSVGFYGIGRKGYEGPRLNCKGSREKSLIYPLSLEFETIWSASRDATAELARLTQGISGHLEPGTSPVD
jgi:hypothetical protein